MSSRIVKLQWVVIGVLVVGFTIVTVIALNRANAIDKARSDQQGNIDSLKRQLQQAKTVATPVPTQLPESSANQATPTPQPHVTISPNSKSNL